eukprot:scaffold19933_cov19-Prasinocladus_malaysianus.AAC.1
MSWSSFADSVCVLYWVPCAQAADPVHTLARLEGLAELVVPLLGSPLVGDNAALRAASTLAAALPGTLGRQGSSLAAALRLVKTAEKAQLPGINSLQCETLSFSPTDQDFGVVSLVIEMGGRIIEREIFDLLQEKRVKH